MKCEVSCYENSLSSRHHERNGTASGHKYKSWGQYLCATARKPGSLKPMFPFGTKVKITSKYNTIIVKIIDTGSYRPKKAKYWFDLNNQAWKDLFNGQRPSRFICTFEVVK